MYDNTQQITALLCSGLEHPSDDSSCTLLSGCIALIWAVIRRDVACLQLSATTEDLSTCLKPQAPSISDADGPTGTQMQGRSGAVRCGYVGPYPLLCALSSRCCVRYCVAI